MENCIKGTTSPLIICPLCKVNIPSICSLQYAQKKPLPIILIQCSCSKYLITLSSFAGLYSQKTCSLRAKEITEKKYLQFSLLLNEIQGLFHQIIECLDLLSSNDTNGQRSRNCKAMIIEIEKKFNYIFIEISELLQKLIIDSLQRNNVKSIENYNRFSCDSILEYITILARLDKQIKEKDQLDFNSIRFSMNKINQITNTFISNNEKEPKRGYRHLHYSLGGCKAAVNWKINHFSKQINFLSMHSDSVECVCELKNGNIVTCGYDKKIQIWDRIKMKVIKVLNGHTKPVLTIIQLDNGLLASGSSDNSIRLWNIDKGICINVLQGHSGNVIKLIQLSNKLLVSCSGDTSLCVWNIDTAEKYSLIGHGLTVESADELSNEEDILLASCSLDRRIFIWNLTTRSLIKSLANEFVKPLICLITLKDGNLLSGSQSQMYLWNWKESILLTTIEQGAYCFIQIASHNIATGSNDNCVKLYSYPEMNVIMVLHGHTSTVISIALLSDGNVISSSWDSTFKIWE